MLRTEQRARTKTVRILPLQRSWPELGYSGWLVGSLAATPTIGLSQSGSPTPSPHCSAFTRGQRRKAIMSVFVGSLLHAPISHPFSCTPIHSIFISTLRLDSSYSQETIITNHITRGRLSNFPFDLRPVHCVPRMCEDPATKPLR